MMRTPIKCSLELHYLRQGRSIRRKTFLETTEQPMFVLVSNTVMEDE